MTFRQRARSPVHVAIVFSVLSGVLLGTQWLWNVDCAIRTMLLRTFERAAPQDVIIVAIDEDSLQSLGDWPWSRRLHGELVRRLSAAGAKVIGLTMLFTESDRTDPDGDQVAAAAFSESGRVVLPVAFDQIRKEGPLIELLPRPIFATGAAALGHVDVDIDPDGRARSIFTFAGLGAPVWPTFSLAMLSVAGEAPTGLATNPAAADTHSEWPPDAGAAHNPFLWVRKDPFIVPLAGPPGHFRQVAYADVLAGRVPPSVFRDAFVLVGATAATLGNRFGIATWGEARMMSGVELNANILDALRRGVTIREVSRPYSIALTMGLVLIAGLFYGLRFHRRYVFALGLLVVVVLTASALYGLHLWFGPSPSLVSVCVLFAYWSWLGLRRQHRELVAERTRSRATLHSITDGVIMLAADGTVTQMNPVAQRLCAFSPAEAGGQPVDTVISFFDPSERTPLSVAGLLQQVERGQSCLERQAILRAKNGDERAVQFSLALSHGRDAGGSEAILAVSDTTDLHILAQVIANQANRDELTGLSNRRVFAERLGNALARARLGRQPLALLVIDLDGFQRFNDAFGYEAGDALLKAVAQRLRTTKRADDALGRLGNDQFCVIVEDLAIEERVGFVAHRLRKVLAAPFVIQGFKVMTTVSVGVAVFPRDGDDVDALLSSARCAAQRAKRRGGNSVEMYSSEGRIIYLHHAKLAHNLKKAFENNELHLLYQPIIDAGSREVCAVEALLRWRQGGEQSISPAEFIPMMEDAGLVSNIGEWVLSTACAQVQAWRRRGWEQASVCINISARQLFDPDLAKIVKGALAESGLDSAALCLEVTETAQMTDLVQAARTMAELHDLGVRLAIDDFGVGYSSLMALKRLPVDALKIDKSLVHDAVINEADAVMMTAVVALAHAMHLTVIAEGIETEAQLSFVRAQNVDQVQGYFVGAPVEPDTVLSHCRATLRQA